MAHLTCSNDVLGNANPLADRAHDSSAEPGDGEWSDCSSRLRLRFPPSQDYLPSFFVRDVTQEASRGKPGREGHLGRGDMRDSEQTRGWAKGGAGLYNYPQRERKIVQTVDFIS